MSKLYNITEEDLGDLERLAPQLCFSLMEHLKPVDRRAFERFKVILSNVRWNYGPPREVGKIPAEDEP